MKSQIKIGIIAGIVSLAVLLVILLLSGTSGEPEVTIPTTTVPQSTPPTTTVCPTEPLADAQAVYDAAKAAVMAADNWFLTYTTSQNRQIGKDSYRQSVSGSASFSGLTGENLLALTEETRTHGSYSDAYKEAYCQGIAYAEMSGIVFSKQMGREDFLRRQLPAVLLDSSLYQSITGYRDEEGIFITFSEATGLESWMAPENAQLIAASGTAVLDNQGILLESTYTAEFSVGGVIYTYTAAVSLEDTEPTMTHMHYESSQKVEDLDVLKCLMQVVGDLFSAASIRCQGTETIDCQQIPLIYIRESALQLTETADAFNAGADYISTITDYREQASVRVQSDSFIDGEFTSTVDGGEPVTDPEMTQQKMRQTIEDAVLSAMMAPNYVSNAVKTDNGDSFTVKMTGNDAFCKDLMTVITAFLQVDLDEIASSHKTLAAEGYLTLDKATMLPTAMGLAFERIHTTSAEEYTLTYGLEYTIALSESE